MNDTEQRIVDLVLKKLRGINPSATQDDLDAPLLDLGLDSLDVLETVHNFEREFHVKADLDRTEKFCTLREYVTYFNSLVPV
jgi:acyl carrier protein